MIDSLLQLLLISFLFFVISLIIYTFYQYYYYVANQNNYAMWAVGKRKSLNLGIKNHWCQMFPFRNKKSSDPPHLISYSFHTIFIVALQYYVIFHFYEMKHTHIPTIVLNTFLLLVIMHFVQYIEHFVMHKYLYKYHKYHHYFKNPEPWDGYYVHPIETYINILIFMIPCIIMHNYIGPIEPLISQSIFFIESGMSHTGVRIGIKYFDQMSTHHEMHHLHSDCNYGTLSPICDKLFGTNRTFVQNE